MTYGLPFTPFSPTLPLPGGHTVSAKQNLLASFSRALFIWSGWNLMWWWNSSSWTPWDSSKGYWKKGNNCCFIDCFKNFNVGMHSDVYESIWFKLGMMIDTVVLYILILVKLTWPWFKVTGMLESKIFCANYLTKCSVDLNWIWKCWDLCDESPHFILSTQYSRERTLLMWLCYLKNPLTFACIQTLTH